MVYDGLWAWQMHNKQLDYNSSYCSSIVLGYVVLIMLAVQVHNLTWHGTHYTRRQH